MQIVIEISEEIYNELKLNLIPHGSIEEEMIVDAVKNGTPLPKGHGDLIDRKELMNSPYRKGGFVEWYDEIKYASAIIPADKGESE